MAESDAAVTTHAESCFDPALYMSLFFSGNFHNDSVKYITEWMLDAVHGVFKCGLLLPIHRFIIKLQ